MEDKAKETLEELEKRKKLIEEVRKIRELGNAAVGQSPLEKKPTQKQLEEQENKDKPKKQSNYKYVRKATGEKEVFEKIWNERPHESFINGQRIYVFNVRNFGHVLPKAQNKYPKFKLYDKCIQLLTFEQHDAWDNGIREELRLLPEWNKMFELEAELLLEYKILHGNGK